MEEENRGMDNQMTYVLWFRQVSLLKLLSNFTFFKEIEFTFLDREELCTVTTVTELAQFNRKYIFCGLLFNVSDVCFA